jgi:hypothetical protein
MADLRQKLRHPVRSVMESMLRVLLAKGRIARWSYRRGWHGSLGVSRHQIALGGAHRLPAPLVVAFASDLHAGPTTDPSLYDDLARQIALAAPDVLLLGGDYVSLGSAHVEQLRGFLGRVSAPLGTYAVIGNHDIWHGREPVERALREAGVHVLVNGNVALPEPFGMVSVCGIDDPWTGEPSVAQALAGVGPIKLFLMHSPDGLWFFDGESFDLAFAGHTHGGQVARASGRPVVPPNGPLSRQYCYGTYELAGKGPLIVSRGVGCSTLPLRVNADPELVLCTLT